MTTPKNLTPMMKQYFKIKSQYTDAILFYRLGDFYEMFYEDAEEAAKILEITLTSRNKKAEDPVPMCGVPYHSADEYIRKLIEAGYKVAICEQMEDARLAKGMVKREVVRVITPGTILQDNALSMKENNYLAAVICHQQYSYLAYVDISTGEIKMTESPKVQHIIAELQSIHPAEIILPETSDPAFATLIRESVQSYYSSYQDSDRDYSNIWQLDSVSQGQSSVLNLLFDFLTSIQIKSFDHFKPVEVYEISNYMQLNQYAKVQLELTRSLRTQRKSGSLLNFIDDTQTAMGGRLLHQWLEKPLIDMVAIETRHQKVEQLMEFYFERVELNQFLKKVYDLERLVSKISLGSANARDIDQLRISLLQIPHLNEILARINQNYQKINQVIFDPFNEFKELVEHICQVLVDQPPISITEGNIIKSGYNELLDQFRDALENGENWLLELQQREREQTGIKGLKVGYNKVFGYYIEMSRLQAQNFVDDRYIRKQTLTNSERFITEELKEIETTILNAQDKATALEYQLFLDLREEISRFLPELQALAKSVAEIDVLCNFAQISESEGYVRPILTKQSKVIELKDSRHPVVETLIGKANFVPNDYSCQSDRFLSLLTGPNMSGKSTYMRQIAYCIILNQIGCFVPAKEAKLPIFDKIFTRIGSADDIVTGQSTFMVEMVETKIALEEATPNSLILFDEIGRGTATYDGMALADGIIKYIASHVKAVTVFATHYHELTELEKQLPCLKNIHVGAQEHNGNLIFLHKVLEGPADKSYGIQVAKLAGLPQSVIEESLVVLADLEAKAKAMMNRDGIEQLDLFVDTESQYEDRYHQLIDQIRSIDVNQMTPIEAIQRLDDLIRQVKNE